MLIRLALIFLILLASNLDKSWADEPINWLDCVKEAKKDHPDLISALEKVNQAKAAKEITRSAYLPQLGFDASETTTKRPSFGVSGSSVALVSGNSAATGANRVTTYQYEVTAQQLLFDGFKISYDLSTNERSIIAAKYFYNVTSSNVRLRLRTAYVNLLTAQEYVKVTEDIEAQRKQILELVRLRYEGGLEHKGSLMTSEADLAGAIYDVTQATRNIYLYQRQLTKELGRIIFSPMVATGDFTVKDTVRVLPNFGNIAETNPLLR